MSQQQAAAADLPADWLAAAFGAGAPVQQAQQAQQAAAGRPVSWDEHAGMFVATPVSSSQPPATLQLPGGSPGQVASRPANPQQKDPGGGGGRSGAPSGLFRWALLVPAIVCSCSWLENQPACVCVPFGMLCLKCSCRMHTRPQAPAAGLAELHAALPAGRPARPQPMTAVSLLLLRSPRPSRRMPVL